MASEIKIKFDTDALDEFVRLQCDAIRCRYQSLRRGTCVLKQAFINRNGACANYHVMTEEEAVEYHKRLEGANTEKG